MAPRRIRTVVVARAAAGHDVVSFVLKDPDGWDLPSFRPGAHLDLYLSNGLVRTYSLVNDPAESDRYVIAVKREPAGRGGSRFLWESLQVGDEIGVGLPRGGLSLAPEAQIFVAGGIGVTPFLSAAAALLRAGRTDFRLHVISRGPPPLPDRLEPLVSAGVAELHDTSTGPRPALGPFLSGDATQAVSCCGPESLIAAFEAAIADWPKHLVHVERFVPPPLVAPPEARSYTLVLARSGAEIDMEAGASMLDTLTARGIAIPSSCCGGICGLCKVDWIEGEPLHRDRALSPEDRRRSLLACVALSASPRLVLDL
ncbi:PDR/VanB family oxidoreductase [Xanthobacter sp.]|uniref:PDR/VanB family oxidoreductase n=1 Tax=Xanthobacter sp. TaxID=35809 RepID=UPI0025EC0045|nr:PDR/VanB family oxidoreductase [Xanthobacter sp.]